MDIKNKINEIRESDDRSKKRWLYVLSGVTMVAIVIVWVFYMNAFIFTDASGEKTETVEVGFWPVFKTGLVITAQNIGEKTKDVISKIGAKIPMIGKENKIIIDNPSTKNN